MVDLAVPDGPADVHGWTRDDVIKWLEEELKLTQYSEAFKLNEIDGEELVNLDSETLSSELNVGKTHAKPRRKRMSDLMWGLFRSTWP